MKKCKWCNKEFDNGLRLGGHQTWCDKNPNVRKTKEKLAKQWKGKKLSEEHKQKISKGRTDYLIKNPDKVPYLINHSSKMSYPEKILFDALNEYKIDGWIYRFQNSIYEYDFAWPDIKLDVEVDGATHLTEKVKKIDTRRDKFSRGQGWTVLRFTAYDVKSDIISCIKKIKEHIE